MKKKKKIAEISLSFIIRLFNYVLFLSECACSTIIDISPRIFSLMYCCCVSIIIVICMCPPVALIWLINLFLFLFRIISKYDDCNIHNSTPVKNMIIGYMESSNRNFSMGNKSNNIVKTWKLHP